LVDKSAIHIPLRLKNAKTFAVTNKEITAIINSLKLLNNNNMKAKILGLFLLTMIVQSSYAQQPPTETIKTSTNKSPEQKEIINLSKQKWDWMADKNVDSLNVLFDDNVCLPTWEAPGVKPRN
jgi:hypothetical protein